MIVGVVGQGFVGTAVYEGLKNHHKLLCYDKDDKVNVKRLGVANLELLAEYSEIIFVCQSPVNAWYQHNHTKIKPQSSNGNRATSKVLTSLIEHLGNTIEFPVIVIELDDQKATSEFHRTMVKSEIYLTNDFKINWKCM